MWTQALLLSLSGAIYPLGLAAVIAYLGSAEPKRNALAFLAGAALMSLGSGIVMVVGVRSLGWTPDRGHPTPGAGLLIAIGSCLILFSSGLYIRHRRQARKPSPPGHEAPPPRELNPRRAFFVGAILYLPGFAYFGACSVIAKSNAGPAATIAALCSCVVALLAMIEIPILFTLFRGARAQEKLARAKDRMASVLWPVALVAGLAAGTFLIAEGMAQLP